MYSLIKRNTKSLLYLSSLLWVLAFVACDINALTDPDAAGNYSASESFSFTVQATSSEQLQVEGINGSIEVIGVSGAATARIWGERIVRSHSSADARSYLKEVEVRVSTSTAQVLAETIQPEDTHGREVVVNYHIAVPAHWQVHLHNANGTARVDSVQNRVAFDIANGQVQASRLGGDLDVALTNGNVFIENAKCNAHVVVSNGNVEATMTLPTTGKCDLGVINGNITLAIPQNTSAQFAAEVTNGSISVADLVLQNETSSRTSVRGQLGSGAGDIKLGTVNGTIRANGF